ncbi:hypothetical protein [Streptomyces sp. NPDC056817]|uniref:hypothetical protein n=1 Tax=Streptomyces sp. NPDC056817 TaxID=3345950 RepID=UPI0036C2CCB2
MLADIDAPAHAESLVQCLSHAHSYADEIRRMLAEGRPDSDRAAILVQAIRNMLCAAEDDLDALDDVQVQLDAVAAIHGLSDVDLFGAITDTPTSGNS